MRLLSKVPFDQLTRLVTDMTLWTGALREIPFLLISILPLHACVLNSTTPLGGADIVCTRRFQHCSVLIILQYNPFFVLFFLLEMIYLPNHRIILIEPKTLKLKSNNLVVIKILPKFLSPLNPNTISILSFCFTKAQICHHPIHLYLRTLQSNGIYLPKYLSPSLPQYASHASPVVCLHNRHF